MSELSFFEAAAPLSLSALADRLAIDLPAGADPARLIDAVAALDHAGPADIAAFAADDIEDLRRTRAGACFVCAQHRDNVPRHTIALVTDEPLAALGQIAALLHPGSVLIGSAFERGGIDPAANVHREARLEQDVTIDPGAIVGPRTEIGTGTTIGANCVIGPGVRIGRHCQIDAQVSIRCALIGDRVAIHAGARIGLDGRGADQAHPSLGRVIIQDDVHVGANAVIERGTLGDTMIGDRARIGTLSVVAADTVVARLAAM